MALSRFTESTTPSPVDRDFLYKRAGKKSNVLIVIKIFFFKQQQEQTSLIGEVVSTLYLAPVVVVAHSKDGVEKTYLCR